jgi:hypothetical protein
LGKLNSVLSEGSAYGVLLLSILLNV